MPPTRSLARLASMSETTMAVEDLSEVVGPSVKAGPLSVRVAVDSYVGDETKRESRVFTGLVGDVKVTQEYRSFGRAMRKATMVSCIWSADEVLIITKSEFEGGHEQRRFVGLVDDVKVTQEYRSYRRALRKARLIRSREQSSTTPLLMAAGGSTIDSSIEGARVEHVIGQFWSFW